MSEISPKPNRQAQRSIEAFEDALLALIREKPFRKITITDLSERSGLTRSTFYAHYETKEHMLDSMIKAVLDEFFNHLRDFYGQDSDSNKVLESDIAFFRIWEKNRRLIPLLDAVDFGCMMVNGLRAYWKNLYQQNVSAALPVISGNYSEYTLTFLSYAFTGFLKEWIRQDMNPSPEIMGEMVYHFTGHEAMISARHKFHDKFTDQNSPV